MAVVRSPQPGSLGIKVQAGTSTTGATLYKTIRFGGLKPAATDDDVFAVAGALADLQSQPVNAIMRFDEAVLASE